MAYYNDYRQSAKRASAMMTASTMQPELAD
jgi:hypothetical protein